MANPFELEFLNDGARSTAVLHLEQMGPDGPRPVVVLDADLIERIDATLDTLPDDLAGLIVASSAERAFIAGADLQSIVRMSDPELDGYLVRGQQVFGRLSQLPFPTAAVIHGAALGGGLELAMHCDLLVGCDAAKPFPIGLPEAGLGLCPGWGGTNLLPARMDAAKAVELTAQGRPMKSDGANDAGVFDAWLPSREQALQHASGMLVAMECPPRDGAPSRWIGRDDAVASACERAAASLGDTATAEAVAACVRVGVQAGWAEALDEERRRLVALRHTEAARSAIEAFFAKSKA